MASPTLDYLRSPFENFYHILPQGHDKALKQAFYNTGATLFVVIVCCASVAVYYILEAFLRPLLWAILCGTFLHPFKNSLTSLVRRWLKYQRDTGTPLVVGGCLIPLTVLDGVSETLGSLIVGNLKLVLAAAVGLPVVYTLYYFWPLQTIFYVLKSSFCVIYDTLGYFSAIWVWSLVAAYLLVVLFYWTPQTCQILKPLSIPVWIILLLHLAAIAGPFRVPLLLVVVVLFIVGFISEIKEARRIQYTAGNETGASSSFLDVLRFWPSSTSDTAETGSSETSLTESPQASSTEIPERDPPQSSSSAPVAKSSDSSSKSESDCPVGVQDTPVSTRPKQLTKQSRVGEHKGDGNLKKKEKPQKLSDLCFVYLFWGIALVGIWMNFWLIYQLGPILLACLLLKKLGARLGSWKWLQDQATLLGKKVTTRIGNDDRLEIIAPKPIQGLLKLILQGDKKVVKTLEGSMDKAVTILIILFLLFGLVFMTFFMAVQVHRESVHLVSVTSNVLNSTLHPDLQQWLPDNAEMQKTIDSMVGNVYLYGRDWISNKLHGALNGDDDSKDRVEKQILDLWDQLYEKWFARSTPGTIKPERQLQRQISLIDLSNVTGIWDLVSKTKDINLDIVSFVKENIGTFMSVIESLWAVLKGNISLAVNFLTLTTSIVFGGGTAILNFIISAVIFLTTLFYLLASSGDQYKPMEWFANLSPQGAGGNKFGYAVEEAISSVFLASLKMAAFYGLYTWLTHTVFGIQIVFIPAALAAIFAVVPFLGTYFAAVPALVELWLVQKQGVLAILLLICHLLPSYVVDTAIYSDIKGGHPYLTGLAIAGGMYWMGLEGAIIGPMLLCCLVVIVNVYSSMLKPEILGTTASAKQRSSGLLSEKKVTFNLKRGFSSPGNID